MPIRKTTVTPLAAIQKEINDSYPELSGKKFTNVDEANAAIQRVNTARSEIKLPGYSGPLTKKLFDVWSSANSPNADPVDVSLFKTAIANGTKYYRPPQFDPENPDAPHPALKTFDNIAKQTTRTISEKGWRPAATTLANQMGAIQAKVDIYKAGSPLDATFHINNIADTLARDYGVTNIGDIGVRTFPKYFSEPVERVVDDYGNETLRGAYYGTVYDRKDPNLKIETTTRKNIRGKEQIHETFSYKKQTGTTNQYYNKLNNKIIPGGKFASTNIGDGYSEYNLRPVPDGKGGTIVLPVQHYSKSGLGEFVQDIAPILPLINAALLFANVPPIAVAAGNVGLQAGAGNVENIGDVIKIAAPILLPAAIKELAAGADVVGSDWATSGAGTAAATIPADVAAGLSSSAVGQAVSNLSNQALTGLAADVVGGAALGGIGAAIYDKDIVKFAALGGFSALAAGAGRAVFEATGNQAYANAASSALNVLAETGDIESAIASGGAAGVTTLVDQTVTRITGNSIAGRAAQLGAISAITGQPVSTGDLADLATQFIDSQKKTNTASRAADSSTQPASIGGSEAKENIIQTDSGDDGADEILTASRSVGQVGGEGTQVAGVGNRTKTDETKYQKLPRPPSEMTDEELNKYVIGKNPETGDYLYLGVHSDEDLEALFDEFYKRLNVNRDSSTEGDGTGTGNGTGEGTGTDTSIGPQITSLISLAKTADANESLRKFLIENGGDLAYLGVQPPSAPGTSPTEDTFQWKKTIQPVIGGPDVYEFTDSTGKVFSLFVEVLPPKIDSDDPDDYFVDENGNRHYYIKFRIGSTDDPDKKIEITSDQAKKLLPESLVNEAIRTKTEDKVDIEVDKDKVDTEEKKEEEKKEVEKTPEQIAKEVRDNNSKAVETRASELINSGTPVNRAVQVAASELGLTSSEYDPPSWSQLGGGDTAGGGNTGGNTAGGGNTGGDTAGGGKTGGGNTGGGLDVANPIGENPDFTILPGGNAGTSGDVGSNQGSTAGGGSTGGGDTVSGAGGADTTPGSGGNDTLISGGGNDTLISGNGNDTLISGGGNDTIISGGGNDTLTSGGGNDTLISGGGNDTLISGGGNDTLTSGGGNDTVTGGGGNDTTPGAGGNDTKPGGGGSDTVSGGGNTGVVITHPLAGNNSSTQSAAAPSETSAKPTDAALPVTKIGETGKFVSPLEGYQQMVQKMYDTAMDEKLQQAPAAYQNPTEDSFWSYGQQKPLESIFGAFNSFFSEPEVKKAEGGAIAALMAVGGASKTGRGSTTLVPHSGKMRVDFRRGDAVTGPGDGQSDDIPAMLADGEFVFPADVVSALGNGSTKAGSDKLYEMMHAIRARARKAHPKSLPPPAKSPLEYLRGKK